PHLRGDVRVRAEGRHTVRVVRVVRRRGGRTCAGEHVAARPPAQCCVTTGSRGVVRAQLQQLPRRPGAVGGMAPRRQESPGRVVRNRALFCFSWSHCAACFP
ncbi:hypothetical protein DQ04_16851000, partial [Trypanosoma grayi]|uniref:hypothetical protein n=1 Tax=Trypanosoma grayi TaxID=71804 RepID=UPI0004F4523E